MLHSFHDDGRTLTSAAQHVQEQVGNEGGEWVQVFTPQGDARVIFPRGPEDGEILSPLAGSLSPLAEKMRGFLPRFHPHWPGWPSQQRAEELRRQEEERRKREEEQRKQEEELRRQEEERKRQEEERRQAIEKARTEMLAELQEELRELEASNDAQKLAKWAEWRKIVKQLLEEPEETEEEREALWRALITEIHINLPGKKPPPLPPTLPPLDTAVLKPMPEPVPEANLNRVTEVHWGIHWKIAYDDYFTGDCEIRLLANSESISMIIGNSSDYQESSENFILDFASKALSPEEWQSLLDAVNIETLRKLSATTECPDCDDNGREWLKVFTPQEEVKLSFPIGEKDGKTLLPLAESASPLAEKMREFLPGFAGSGWPGWPGYWANWLDWLHWISWYPEGDW